MNQQKSLIQLLLVSTAALSGCQKHSHKPSNASQMRHPQCGCHNSNSQQGSTTYSSTSPSSTIMSNMLSSATAAAQADSVFLPVLLPALYAADYAVGLNPESTGPYSLSPLEYDYNALEPYISEATMRMHHGTHHAKYVDNLNDALSLYPELYGYTLSEMLLFSDRLPSDIQAQVLHNAGGTYNHDLTCKLIGPANNTYPTGAFAESINRQFGSFENLVNILTVAGESVVGTGYAWLALNPYGRMIVVTSEEQLTPIALRSVPLLPIDVWEHAHYLDTGANRQEYLDNYFNTVNWERVEARYDAARNIFDNTMALQTSIQGKN